MIDFFKSDNSRNNGSVCALDKLFVIICIAFFCNPYTLLQVNSRQLFQNKGASLVEVRGNHALKVPHWFLIDLIS